MPTGSEQNRTNIHGSAAFIWRNPLGVLFNGRVNSCDEVVDRHGWDRDHVSRVLHACRVEVWTEDLDLAVTFSEHECLSTMI